MNIDFAWLSKAARGAVTFSKKNLPTIMLGASIIGFWTSIVMIAREAPKAKEELDSQPEPASFKAKAIVYVKHCWKGGLVGIASTAVGIGAHHINLERLAGAYMLTQFYKEDGEKLKKQILKKEGGEKELENLKKAALEEDFPDDAVKSFVEKTDGNGNTLVIDTVTGARWKGDIVTVMSGIAESNDELRDDYVKAKKRASPFSAKDGPHSDNDYDPEIYGSLSVSDFLENIGMPTNFDVDGLKIGSLLEFRCYSTSDLLKPKHILRYKPYTAPGEDAPKVCFLDYSDLLGPSSELLERYP
jgi:hypothetical protein